MSTLNSPKAKVLSSTANFLSKSVSRLFLATSYYSLKYSAKILALTATVLATTFGLTATASAGFFDDLIAGSRFNPNDISVESVDYGGDGCRPGTVSVILSPGATELTVLFDDFQTRVGADVANSRKNCEVKVKIRKPRLWSYRIDSVDFRGFIHLDRGVRAEQKVDFQNGPSHAGFNKSFGYQRWVGPTSENYLLQTIKPLNGPDLLSCLPAKKSVELKLRSSIELKGGGGHKGGMMAVDSADGRVVHRYRLSWISCLKEFKNL
ncbi:MAG: DUF4360 domain-containing protein [Bdellovibrionales bacterium]|nr:DUF4360 domain-containing protein [Bdellovibrionales bacterium]